MHTVVDRTHSFDPITRRHSETVTHSNGSVITYTSAPMARMAYENSYDLITPELRRAMDINLNSVISAGRSVEIRNCRVQNHPSRHGTLKIRENSHDDFDLSISYRSRRMTPVKLSGLTGEQVTNYLRTALAC